MKTPPGPLKGVSILIIGDDRLGAFLLHRTLVAAGARVAQGDLAAAEPYLGAAALGAVVVAADLNATDARRLRPMLAACAAPWVAYGDGPAHARLADVHHVAAGAQDLLVAQLAALCAGARH